jgi:hypothetical protein
MIVSFFAPGAPSTRIRSSLSVRLGSSTKAQCSDDPPPIVGATGQRLRERAAISPWLTSLAHLLEAGSELPYCLLQFLNLVPQPLDLAFRGSWPLGTKTTATAAELPSHHFCLLSQSLSGLVHPGGMKVLNGRLEMLQPTLRFRGGTRLHSPAPRHPLAPAWQRALKALKLPLQILDMAFPFHGCFLLSGRAQLLELGHRPGQLPLHSFPPDVEGPLISARRLCSPGCGTHFLCFAHYLLRPLVLPLGLEFLRFTLHVLCALTQFLRFLSGLQGPCPTGHYCCHTGQARIPAPNPLPTHFHY